MLIREDSTVISWISYDHEEKELRVCFKSSQSIWQYQGVAPGEFGKLAAAYSVGRVFNERIRDRYDAQRLSPTKQILASK